MKHIRLILALLAALPICAWGQGALTPPGAPAPTMKSLAQIEPRTPISTVPLTISNGGSYYFTTNLTGVSATNGITISASDVTIDLNGFALIGVAGALTGITSAAPVLNLKVRNGTIRNGPAGGIGTPVNDVALDGLNVYSNGGAFGIRAGAHAKIRDCMVALNGGGLAVGQASSVSGSVIRHNSTNGLAAADGATVLNCLIYANGANGLSLSNASSVADCTIRTNGQNGIVGLAGVSVTRCNISLNNSNGVLLTSGGRVTDCVVSSNKVDGINLSSRSTVTGNLCDFNGTTGTHAGIRVTSTDNRIEENNLVSNINGILSDIGFNLILRNKATLNTTNYSFHVSDVAGPSSGNPTTAGPWANFTY